MFRVPPECEDCGKPMDREHYFLNSCNECRLINEMQRFRRLIHDIAMFYGVDV
jgi:hypothetical protein